VTKSYGSDKPEEGQPEPEVANSKCPNDSQLKTLETYIFIEKEQDYEQENA
jgi:hypothetical protein